MVAHLVWRKQNSGPRGRALDADIPALGLKKHDRLEPWTGLQDIGDEFDQLQPTEARPVRVCFWRRSEETATRHRSPLLDTGLHTGVNSLTIDILRCCFVCCCVVVLCVVVLCVVVLCVVECVLLFVCC